MWWRGVAGLRGSVWQWHGNTGCDLLWRDVAKCAVVVRVVLWQGVTIPPWGPLTTCSEEQEAYGEEDIQALLRMHMMSDEEEQESYEPEQDSWQISPLISAYTFDASHDTGNVRTGRMEIT